MRGCGRRTRRWALVVNIQPIKHYGITIKEGEDHGANEELQNLESGLQNHDNVVYQMDL